MRFKLTTLFLSLILAFSPVQAQTDTPAPTPRPAEVVDAVERGADAFERGADVLVDASQQIGANSVMTFMIIILMAGILWFIVRPLMANSFRSNSDLASARRESADAQRQLLTYVQSSDTKNVERQDRLTVALEGVATSYEASLKGFDGLAYEVRQHHQAVDDSTVNLLQYLGVGKDKKTMTEYISDTAKVQNDKLDTVIALLRGIALAVPQERPRINQAIEAVQEVKSDTGPLSPEKVPDEDPSKSSSQPENPV